MTPDKKAGESDEDESVHVPVPKDAPMVEGRDFYFDPDGLWVMTAAYLKRRGYCCGSGCRHCPYEHVNVPQKPKR